MSLTDGFLGQKEMVGALLDRLRHRCHTIRVEGQSLRDPSIVEPLDFSACYRARRSRSVSPLGPRAVWIPIVGRVSPREHGRVTLGERRSDALTNRGASSARCAR